MINNLEFDEFKYVFSSLGSLIDTEDASFIKETLPYLVYYAVRFSEGMDIIQKIHTTLTEILE